MNIVKPVITEKSYSVSAKNVFTFRVDKKMRKEDIRKAVVAQYGVEVTDVRTVMMATKTKRVGKKRTEIRLPTWKKAYVTLGKNSRLNFFDQKEEQKEPVKE